MKFYGSSTSGPCLGSATSETSADLRDIEEPCTTALALDPPRILPGDCADAWRSVRNPRTWENCLIGQRNSMNPARGHDQFRVQLWSGFYKTTWASYGRYGDAHTSRFVRPLARRATLISIDELVLVAQNVRAGAAAASVVGFCRWPRRTAGRRIGSLSRFGDGVDQSVVAALVASGMRRAG